MVTPISLDNATVLDVRAGELLLDRCVIVEGSRIREVAPAGKFLKSGSRIDVGRRVVMPGLCDAHVHVTAITPDFARLSRLAPSYVAAHSARILGEMLQRGFTTVRDAGGADHGIALAVEEGLVAGPRVLFCGKAISQTGGHGDMRLPGEHDISSCGCCAGLGRICDGVPEVRKACRDMIRTGAHHIKLMVSGGVSSPTDRITSTQLADDELSAAVEEARAANIYCMAHAYTPRAIARAVRAGVRSIEHGNLLDRETAILMRDAGAFLVPTLSTYEALAREGVAGGLPADMIHKLETVLHAGREALEIAQSEGLQIAYGSDLLGAMHRHQLNEFSLRAEIQTPLEIIRGATLIAARLFGMEGEIGEIVAGARADLLVLNGNPLEDLALLQDPAQHLRLTMAGGQIAKNAL